MAQITIDKLNETIQELKLKAQSLSEQATALDAVIAPLVTDRDAFLAEIALIETQITQIEADRDTL